MLRDCERQVGCAYILIYLYSCAPKHIASRFIHSSNMRGNSKGIRFPSRNTPENLFENAQSPNAQEQLLHYELDLKY